MKPYEKLSLAYFILGVIWILTSDRLVGIFTSEPDVITEIQTLKGWFFVLISTLIVYVLSRRLFQQQDKAARERKEVFKSTVGGACHILLNYLNQMQLITLEAHGCPDFDKELLARAESISREVSEEMRKLAKLDIKEARDVEAFVYRHLESLE